MVSEHSYPSCCGAASDRHRNKIYFVSFDREGIFNLKEPTAQCRVLAQLIAQFVVETFDSVFHFLAIFGGAPRNVFSGRLNHFFPTPGSSVCT